MQSQTSGSITLDITHLTEALSEAVVQTLGPGLDLIVGQLAELARLQKEANERRPRIGDLRTKAEMTDVLNGSHLVAPASGAALLEYLAERNYAFVSLPPAPEPIPEQQAEPVTQSFSSPLLTARTEREAQRRREDDWFAPGRES